MANRLAGSNLLSHLRGSVFRTDYCSKYLFYLFIVVRCRRPEHGSGGVANMTQAFEPPPAYELAGILWNPDDWNALELGRMYTVAKSGVPLLP